MFIKSITLKGFKSFPKKTHIKLDQGLAVLVGPNGSGKSNIVDAILWVLGEQSYKSLRSETMTDLIFTGNKTQQQSDSAEVFLEFDNSKKLIPLEYSYFTIGRTLSRDGYSGYLINGKSAQLHKLREVLSEAALGKGLYSVISQGEIENVLAAKPEERREMIDEALGILKHKTRKRKVIKKIDNINEKIVRVKDVHREIKRQLAPLEKQAKDLRRYNDISDEIKIVENHIQVENLNKLKSSWDEIENQIVDKTKEKNKLSSAISEKTKLLSDKKQDFKNLMSDTDDTGSYREEIIKINERFRGIKMLVTEKQKNINSKISYIEKEIRSKSELLKNNISDKSGNTLFDELKNIFGPDNNILKTLQQSMDGEMQSVIAESLEHTFDYISKANLRYLFTDQMIHEHESIDDTRSKPISSFVKLSEKPKISNLLNIIHVTKNMRDSIELSKKYKGSYIFVSDDGVVLPFGIIRKPNTNNHKIDMDEEISLNGKNREKLINDLKKEETVYQAKIDILNNLSKIIDRSLELIDKTDKKHKTKKTDFGESFRKKEREVEQIEDEIILLEKHQTHISEIIHEIELEKAGIKAEVDICIKNITEFDNVPLDYKINEYNKNKIKVENNIKAKRKSKAEYLNNLKLNLKNIGLVNPIATNEFEELSARNEYYSNQLNDLEKGKSEMKKIIKELDELVIKTFNNSFPMIEESFAKIIGKFFPEGNGNLKTTDDDVIQCGIDITVQPKGKNLQKLSLLSGGERSMAALAFILSLFLSRITPFCIMDEVDAALDDINLSRLINLFREISNKTQLVLITHQKKTMEAADFIYGISLDPNGSSVVLSQKVKHR